jgi:hypothetical protein
MSADPHVILVGGFEFHGKGTRFGVWCDKRREVLLRRKTMAAATFWKFDFGPGLVLRDKPERNKHRGWRPYGKADPVAKASYTNGTLDPSLKTLSITDVYRHIYSVVPVGSVVELSFFSHAFSRGPILLNTWDHTPSNLTGKRDPADKDARPKDFNIEQMPSHVLKAFREGFAPSPVVWIWGCNGESRCWEVFRQLRNSPAWKKTPSGKHSLDVTFPLTFQRGQVGIWHSEQPVLFPDPGPNDPDRKGMRHSDPFTWEATLGQVVNAFRNGLTQTYMWCFSKALGSPVTGALPGTTAVLNGRDGLMEVARNRATQHDDFSALIRFYKDYVGVVLDPEGRGYGLFDQKQAA